MAPSRDWYLHGPVTKLKVVLPVGKARAWQLIASPKGISSWLPFKCTGHVKQGAYLKFGWRDGTTDQLRVVYMGEKHSSLRLQRSDQTQLRFYLHGKMTTLTLEVQYADTTSGRTRQVSELPLWSFRVANLKSVALGGRDLRHKLRGRTSKMGFLD